MFCHKCGAQLPEGAGFCHKCGTKTAAGIENNVSDSISQNHADAAKPTDVTPNKTQPSADKVSQWEEKYRNLAESIDKKSQTRSDNSSDSISERPVKSSPKAGTPNTYQMPISSQSYPTAAIPKKKKSTLPIIVIIAVVIAVIAAVYILLFTGGQIEYDATAMGYRPYSDFNFNLQQVSEKYIDSRKLTVESIDKKTKVGIVKLDGTIKGTSSKISITIKIEPVPDNPGKCQITPVSVLVDDNKYPPEGEPQDFIFLMFASYADGREDLSSLFNMPNDEQAGLSNEYNSSELMLDDVSVESILSMSAEEIESALGKPVGTGNSYTDLEFYYYGFSIYDVGGKNENITVDPKMLTVNGTMLYLNKDDLNSVFGTPYNELELDDEDGGYYMYYDFPSYKILFKFRDLDSKTYNAWIKKKDIEDSLEMFAGYYNFTRGPASHDIIIEKRGDSYWLTDTFLHIEEVRITDENVTGRAIFLDVNGETHFWELLDDNSFYDMIVDGNEKMLYSKIDY